MSLAVCTKHGPYVADTSTDFGETWCPDCGPHGPRFEISPREREDNVRRDEYDFGTQEFEDEEVRPQERLEDE